MDDFDHITVPHLTQPVKDSDHTCRPQFVDKIEQVTSDLFPKIHFHTSQNELDYYRKTILDLVNIYSKHFSEFNFIKNKDVLEVGAGGRGSGIYALEAFQPNIIHAIDLSEKNVENTKKICDKFGYDNINIKQGNAMLLDYPDNYFDFAFSNGVIHHTKNTYQCFLEMVRILKPGGHLFLGIYGYGGIWGKIVHPMGMFLGKIIPLNIIEEFVNKTGFLKSAENSLLDWFYAPIQSKYKNKEVISWFQNNGFTNILSMNSPKWFYNLGLLTSILFGDGYMFVMGKKLPE